jgi:acetyltransferase-like isoleucine patch superfamily enzyme
MKAVKQITISNTPYNICDMGLRKALGGVAQEINWSNDIDLNTFTKSGIYHIIGERLTTNDNIPINNAASGHTIDATLQVLNSSLPNVDVENTDACVTQVLTISNRVGGDGDIYIRTGRGINANSITWESWGKLQTNIELGQVSGNKLKEYVDNGIYSGVCIDDNIDTFVMVVINNYAIAKVYNNTRHITQFIYSVNLIGEVKFKYRIGSGDENIVWTNWNELDKSQSDTISLMSPSSFADANIDNNGINISIGSIYQDIRTQYRNVSVIACDISKEDIVTLKNGKDSYFKSITLSNPIHKNKSGYEVSSIKISGENTLNGKKTNEYVLIGDGTLDFSNKTKLYIGTIMNELPENENSIVLGENINIKSNINIGENTNIGNNASLGENISINDKSKIGSEVYIGTSTHIKENVEIGDNVKIGDNVEIGEGVNIPKGITISTFTLENNKQGLRLTYDGKKIEFELN